MHALALLEITSTHGNRLGSHFYPITLSTRTAPFVQKCPSVVGTFNDVAIHQNRGMHVRVSLLDPDSACTSLRVPYEDVTFNAGLSAAPCVECVLACQVESWLDFALNEVRVC